MQLDNNRINPLFIKIFTVAVSSALCTSVVIFLLVLPLCYGIDLTGMGERLWINTALFQNKSATGIAAYEKEGQASNTTTLIDNKPVVQSITGAPDHAGDIQEAHQDAVVLTVPAKQNLSFRFYMERDYDLTYHWATDGKPLYAELRGENPAVTTVNTVKVFGKLTENRAKGFFIPPFTGNYTLYWENKTDKPVSIRLTAKGVYKVLS